MLFSLTYACQFEEEVSPNELKSPLSAASNDTESEYLAASTGGEIILGEQLENPYSLQNMQLAWNIEKQNNQTIYTTHRYIRFFPKNEDEMDILENAANMEIYDHPLDYNIISNGDYYHDPSIAAELPTYQYASIPIGQALPSNIAYTVLEQLYIPDETDELFDALVYRALEQTGNLTAEEHRQNGEHPNNGNGNNGNNDNDNANGLFGSSSSWVAKGRIQVFDHAVGSHTQNTSTVDYWVYYDCGNGSGDGGEEQANLGGSCRYPVYVTTSEPGSYVGVHDVKVRARRWFTTHVGYTDEQGYYTCNSSFKRAANYSIKWEKYHFSVRSGTFGQAKLNGPKQSSDWNVKLGNQNSDVVNDKQQYYALIFQAARDYYYGNRFGLSISPTNGFWKPQVKIKADDTTGEDTKKSHAAQYARLGGILPTMYVRAYEKSSDAVYAVTAHELAHLAHWDMDRSTFRGLADDAYAISLTLISPITGLFIGGENQAEAVIESWAEGVEWRFAQERYENKFGVNGYQFGSNYQNRTITGSPVYTPLVVDLIDNENQRITKNNISLPQDNISGFSILQIEQGLNGASSWNQWRDNLKNGQTTQVQQNLDELFSNWY